VIHQLTQAGRTLVAVLLCCKTDVLQHLIPPGLDALRSCIGLLRRFSGRYVCGLRSGDLMEEFCRRTRISCVDQRRKAALMAFFCFLISYQHSLGNLPSGWTSKRHQTALDPTRTQEGALNCAFEPKRGLAFTPQQPRSVLAIRIFRRAYQARVLIRSPSVIGILHQSRSCIWYDQ
jgi:hypothetical protein